MKKIKNTILGFLFVILAQLAIGQQGKEKSNKEISHSVTYLETAHRKIEVNGLSIFYRETGDPNKETILMLHGFPSSSHMYRDVMKKLAADFHVVAPDYPGFGFSDAPSTKEYEYTFHNVSLLMDAFVDKLNIDSFYIMMQDYGGPIGFRMALRRPEKVKGFIVQNANAYFEGLSGEWAQKYSALLEANDAKGVLDLQNWWMSLEGIKAMYLGGVKDPSKVDPISYLTDEAFLRREGINQIQVTFLNNYGSNFDRYPAWQKYLRDHQPPTLVIWGIHDKFFSVEGAKAFSKDLKDVETHLIDGSHFLLELHSDVAAKLIKDFINRI
ncbi:alpha/beta fold hydrolase [Allomuricauda sp. SCSIO 65647]|uniref:alpha/beta fold hydrolase n=1 Tax=Allomuricauda sp. SCSIO 65647 TaxID=2908843 RepID=UPI001F1BB7B0|nr:alpha/beta hydrolase [Muricauda sp. SCSIO 65647]UJH68607.1 alpha/beta hydrolase [Muricauda sp. SCSIO 65647]